MNCPTCDYEFVPDADLQCPRCGERVDCGTVSCSDCDACTGLLGGLKRWSSSPDREGD